MTKNKWRSVAIWLLIMSAICNGVILSMVRPHIDAKPDTVTVYLTKTVTDTLHTTQVDTIWIHGENWLYIPGTRIPIAPKGK